MSTVSSSTTSGNEVGINLFAEAHWQAFLEHIPHLVWRLDQNTDFTSGNSHWARFTGSEQASSLGQSWKSNFHLDDLSVLNGALEQARVQKTSVEVEVRIRNTSEKFLWHKVSLVPQIVLTNTLVGWIITAINCEYRRQLEIELKNAKQESMVAHQARSAFLSNMSHEIRTPLGIVLGFAELLSNSDLSAENRASYLKSIQKNGELVSKLIGDILDLSSLEIGQCKIEKIQLNLIEFFNEIVDSFRPHAQHKNLEVQLFVQSTVPSEIMADPMRLRQILFNVISNAIKFTDEAGCVMINVDVEEHPPGAKNLKIRIEDQGIGIHPEVAKGLFQPFVQGPPSTHRLYGGTGVGLALSQRLARQMGGDLHLVPTASGKGSAFVLNLELEEGRASPSLFEKSIVPFDHAPLFGARVLVVEDAPENQFLLRTILSKAGAEVLTANNGQEGVEKARAENVDLVLMDIQMPVLDGYQAVRILREGGFRKPILALTAYALKEERERCLRAGCDEHLTKPVNRKLLLQQMIRFISSKAKIEHKELDC